MILKLQEIMMLLIGESAMSFAHLVNGAVVNVRGRVSKFLPVLELFYILFVLYLYHIL